MPGIWIRPPTSASTESTPIAAFIDHDCSAMWCSGPGKPMSVSSSSPLAGLRGSSWATWPLSISSCASLQGVPGRIRKTKRKV